MQSKNRLIVRTAKRSADAIAARIGDMRNWLDRYKIELCVYRPIAKRQQGCL